MICCFENCNKIAVSKKLCQGHYAQFRRKGTLVPIRKFRFIQIDQVNQKQFCSYCEYWLDYNCFGKRKDRNNAPQSKCNRCKTYEKYNLTAREYDEILKKQNYECACCGISSEEKNLHVDHDHACCKTGKSCGKCVRDLLCNDCNAVIGHLKESVKAAKKVLAYLEKMK